MPEWHMEMMKRRNQKEEKNTRYVSTTHLSVTTAAWLCETRNGWLTEFRNEWLNENRYRWLSDARNMQFTNAKYLYSLLPACVKEL